MGQRAERFANSIQRELVELIRDVKDPRVQSATLVTVTHVRVSDDFGVANVKISVIPGEGSGFEAKQVVWGLRRAAGFLHNEVGRRLHAKKIPELRFFLDETEERAGKIDELLREVGKEPPVGASSDAADAGGLPAASPLALPDGGAPTDEAHEPDDEQDDDDGYDSDDDA